MKRWDRAPAGVCLYALLSVLGCQNESMFADGPPDLAEPPDASGPSGLVLTSGAADRLLLRGTLLLPDGPLYGELLVDGNTIACAAASCSDQPKAQGATVIKTPGIILPGLIDAHNHGLFNIFDEDDWNPGVYYGNHNQWTSNPRYSQVVDAKQYLNSEGGSPVDLRCEIDKYAELKAVLAGTTSFLLAPGAVNLSCYQSLARTIDTQHNDLGQDLMRTSISVPNASTAQTICAAFASGACNAYVVHVGEGIDGTARNEFATLESRNGGCLLAPQTTIVHGTAFTAVEFAKMAAANMRLVWSPKSNLFLYNDTTRIDLAIAAGVKTIAIAPDWALGGSVNMLDELRVANQVNLSKFGGILTPKRLFEMVTIEPARAIGVDSKLGSLEVGKRADIVLISGDAGAPYDALLKATPATVDLVMVDGRVLYGSAPLKSTGATAPGCEDLTVCNATKFLCAAEPGTANKLNQTYAEIEQAVVSGLQNYDQMVASMGIAAFSPRAPLTKCP